MKDKELIFWNLLSIFLILTPFALACRPGAVCSTGQNLIAEKYAALAKQNNETFNYTYIPRHPIPDQITLYAYQIKIINNMRPADGSTAYQSGYFAAIQDLTSYMGIREHRFNPGPSSGFKPIDTTNQSLIMPIMPGNYVNFNLSFYTFEIDSDMGEIIKSSCLTNFTEPYKHALYNVSYYDTADYWYWNLYNQPWENVSRIRGQYQNVTWARTWLNDSLKTGEYSLRVYLK